MLIKRRLYEEMKKAVECFVRELKKKITEPVYNMNQTEPRRNIVFMRTCGYLTMEVVLLIQNMRSEQKRISPDRCKCSPPRFGVVAYLEAIDDHRLGIISHPHLTQTRVQVSEKNTIPITCVTFCPNSKSARYWADTRKLSTGNY